MDIGDLKVFDAVARLGSMSRAAVELHMSCTGCAAITESYTMGSVTVDNSFGYAGGS